MVLKVDLSQENIQNGKNIDIKHNLNIPKADLKSRIKNKIRVWQSNLSKMPTSHKAILFFLGISITILASIALIYGYIIFTKPAYTPIDTSYKLLEASSTENFDFLIELPIPPAIKDRENPINGELYTKDEFEELVKRKPLIVMIENHLDARPQAGLTDADLIYETLVESGITRYMVVFWGKDSKKVGPIRSVRSYFLDWVSEYDDPPLCNIGQAGYESWEEVIVPEADARSYIIRYNIKSYSWYGRNVTWRDKEKYNKGIAWEHVAYSETQTLWKDAQTLGWVGPAEFESLKFKKDAKKEERSLSQEIEIKFLNLSSTNYKVNWIYDIDSNSYKRLLADKPHIDENNNKQITAKNIIIEHCQYRQTGDRNGRLVFTTIGEGNADIIRDGEVLKGTWKKQDRTSRTKFYYNNEEVELNRGQTWIEIVPVSGSKEVSTIIFK
jgi:hypothetical protein